MRQIYCNHCLHIIGVADNYTQSSITCPACGEEVSAHEVAGDPEAASRVKIISRPTQRIIGEVVGVVALLIICVLVYVFFIRGDASEVNTQDGISMLAKSPAQLEREDEARKAVAEAKRLADEEAARLKAAEDARIAADKQAKEDAAAKLRADAAAKAAVERDLRLKQLDQKRKAKLKVVPVVTWLDAYDDYELDKREQRLAFYKATQRAKQMTMGTNLAVMGVGFGPEVAGLKDEGFVEFKKAAVANFTEMLAAKGTTLNDKSIDQQFMGDSYVMYRANLTKPLYQMFVGIQDGRAVFYWYNGSKLLLKKFRGAISQGEYREEYK